MRYFIKLKNHLLLHKPAIAFSFPKTTIATHLKSNNDRLFPQTHKCLKRSPPQSNVRNSSQIKKRSLQSVRHFSKATDFTILDNH
ncbi:hypothetical protein [Pseudanabaena minima]|uniref:hypothetical protein n=1 Tax=Pseudanabaena minima TaxID=890415 RepID=UPI003DA8366C